MTSDLIGWAIVVVFMGPLVIVLATILYTSARGLVGAIRDDPKIMLILPLAAIGVVLGLLLMPFTVVIAFMTGNTRWFGRGEEIGAPDLD